MELILFENLAFSVVELPIMRKYVKTEGDSYWMLVRTSSVIISKYFMIDLCLELHLTDGLMDRVHTS